MKTKLFFLGVFFAVVSLLGMGILLWICSLLPEEVQSPFLCLSGALWGLVMASWCDRGITWLRKRETARSVEKRLLNAIQTRSYEDMSPEEKMNHDIILWQSIVRGRQGSKNE